MGGAPHQGLRARWVGYLDALEQAALAFAEQIAAGGTPEWPDLAMPGNALPASLSGRRDEVVAIIEQVTSQAEQRRDEISTEIAALARAVPAPAPDAPTSLGHALDVVG